MNDLGAKSLTTICGSLRFFKVIWKPRRALNIPIISSHLRNRLKGEKKTSSDWELEL